MRFNTKVAPVAPDTENLAGGQAYSQSAKLELASLLLTSFASDTYYEPASERFKRLGQLVAKEPYFAAQALVFARTEYGMRSITHAGAALLAKHASGRPWATKFYEQIVYRPDDMMEIVAAYRAFNTDKAWKMPNAMRRGFKKAFDKFDGYQLAKYRASKADMKLIDIVNLVRPIPTERNRTALTELVNNTLRNTETWEAKLTEAGSNAAAKEAVWLGLLSEKKLGYTALLRNLRNILEQAPGATSMVCEALVNEKAIQKSLVLPFQYVVALDAVQNAKYQNAATTTQRLVIDAIHNAVEIALNNIAPIAGSNLVVLDKSGSMFPEYNKGLPAYKAPIVTGALFASVLRKKANADVITFGNAAQYYNLRGGLSVLAGAEELMRGNMGGTDYRTWVNLMTRNYDRIFILSDGEAWEGYRIVTKELNAYRAKYNCNPHIFNFDLAGNGTMQFPEKKTACIAGFSDKTLKLIQLIELGESNLVHSIENHKSLNS